MNMNRKKTKKTIYRFDLLADVYLEFTEDRDYVRLEVPSNNKQGYRTVRIDFNNGNFEMDIMLALDESPAFNFSGVQSTHIKTDLKDRALICLTMNVKQKVV